MLAQATRTLDDFDVVGTTEDLGCFRRRLDDRLGIDLGALEYRNTAVDPQPVSAELRQQIEQDCARDRVLYEHARRL